MKNLLHINLFFPILIIHFHPDQLPSSEMSTFYKWTPQKKNLCVVKKKKKIKFGILTIFKCIV